MSLKSHTSKRAIEGSKVQRIVASNITWGPIPDSNKAGSKANLGGSLVKASIQYIVSLSDG
jgi:hypothetical protein